ncbi:MAG: serine/threonine-protein kinase [Gaiellaceae bacterium]
MPADADTTLPSRYREPRLLARGGMGEIYRATDRELGRQVAVKVLTARYAADESLRRRFEREALAAARLSGNPRIVTIFDVAEHDGRPLIVMELLPGGSLEERLAGGAPIPAAQALDWLDDAAAALDAAHEVGIVHRDVKPGNLLLDERGRVKVADFGIASAAGLDSFTQAGTILGTAGYLSPEQAKGERAGAASDRYSLGVVAWELLTGRRPFASETATAEAAAHAQAPVPSITEARRDLPRGYDAIFARALAKDPARRYETAGELVGDLRRGLHDDAGDTWIEPRSQARERSTVVRRPRPRRWFPAAAALLVAAGVVAAVIVSHDGKTPAPQLRTVVRTVTGPERTAVQTVTAQPATSGASGAALNDAGFAKLRAGDYAGALPLLEQSVARLQGTGSLDEAYADYNLAYTRLALSHCGGVLELLDRSEQVQGHRPEINRLRKDARRSC